MSKYSYSLDENIDSLDQAQAEEAGLPILKFKETNKLYRFRVLPPSPAWAAFFEERGIRPIPFFFWWKHLREDPRNPGRWIAYNCLKRNAGRECPDCEAGFALYNSDSPADKEAAKSWFAKRRCGFVAIDRDNVSAGPQIVEFSAPFSTDPDKQRGKKTQWTQLETLIKVSKKNVVDPGPGGFDVTLIKTGKGQGTDYTIGVEGPCALSADEDQIAAWVENQPDMPAFIAVPTEETLSRKLNMQISSGRVSQVEQHQLSDGLQETAGDIIEGELVGDSDDDW